MLTAVFYAQLPRGHLLVCTWVGLALGVMLVHLCRQRWGHLTTVEALCNMSPLLFVVTIFQRIGDMAPYLRREVDTLLIKVDLHLLGVHPTVWLERIMAPWLTDILSLAYVTYFFIPLILVGVLAFLGPPEKCALTAFTLLFGFYMAYLTYILMPAVGPRYALTAEQSTPLIGGPVAWYVMSLLDTLEYNKWDCFPSGHTQIVLISLWFSYQCRRGLFWLYLPMVVALIISTVYLRYHYVIDVVAGFLWAAAAIILAPMVWRTWVTKNTERSGRSYTSVPPRPLLPSA